MTVIANPSTADARSTRTVFLIPLPPLESYGSHGRNHHARSSNQWSVGYTHCLSNPSSIALDCPVIACGEEFRRRAARDVRMQHLRDLRRLAGDLHEVQPPTARGALADVHAEHSRQQPPRVTARSRRLRRPACSSSSHGSCSPDSSRGPGTTSARHVALPAKTA